MKLLFTLILVCLTPISAPAQTPTSKAAMRAAVSEVTKQKPRPSYKIKSQPANKTGSWDDLLLWLGLGLDELTTAMAKGRGCVEAGLVKNRAAAAVVKIGLAVGWEVGEVKNPNFAANKVNKGVKATAGTAMLGASAWNTRQDCRGRR